MAGGCNFWGNKADPIHRPSISKNPDPSVQNILFLKTHVEITLSMLIYSIIFQPLVPILFLVQDNPLANYLVMVFIVFLTSMAILLLIFIPKVVLARIYSGERREEFEMKNRSKYREHSDHMLFLRENHLRWLTLRTPKLVKPNEFVSWSLLNPSSCNLNNLFLIKCII